MPIARGGRSDRIRADSHRLLMPLLLVLGLRGGRRAVVEPRPGEEGCAVALEAPLQQLPTQALAGDELDGEGERGYRSYRPAYEQQLDGDGLGVLAEEGDVDELVRPVVRALACPRGPRPRQRGADGGGAEEGEDRGGREPDTHADENEPGHVACPEARAAAPGRAQAGRGGAEAGVGGALAGPPRAP